MEFSEPTLAVSCSHAEGSHGDKGEVASSKLSDPKDETQKSGFQFKFFGLFFNSESWAYCYTFLIWDMNLALGAY